jgi:hypothetical protein
MNGESNTASEEEVEAWRLDMLSSLSDLQILVTLYFIYGQHICLWKLKTLMGQGK